MSLAATWIAGLICFVTPPCVSFKVKVAAVVVLTLTKRMLLMRAGFVAVPPAGYTFTAEAELSRAFANDFTIIAIVLYRDFFDSFARALTPDAPPRSLPSRLRRRCRKTHKSHRPNPASTGRRR